MLSQLATTVTYSVFSIFLSCTVFPASMCMWDTRASVCICVQWFGFWMATRWHRARMRIHFLQSQLATGNDALGNRLKMFLDPYSGWHGIYAYKCAKYICRCAYMPDDTTSLHRTCLKWNDRFFCVRLVVADNFWTSSSGVALLNELSALHFFLYVRAHLQFNYLMNRKKCKWTKSSTRSNNFIFPVFSVYWQGNTMYFLHGRQGDSCGIGFVRAAPKQ